MADLLKTTPDLADEARRDHDPVMDVGIAPSAWRLPATIHLGHVTLQVSNLERSLAYYTQVLGLHVIEQKGNSALLGTTDGATRLVELRERAGANPAHGKLGLYHFAILLPNRAALGRFVSHLAESGVRA